MDRPTKVCNLQLAIGANKNVFWFYISVYDLLAVAVLEGITDLVNVLFQKKTKQRNKRITAQNIRATEKLSYSTVSLNNSKH